MNMFYVLTLLLAMPPSAEQKKETVDYLLRLQTDTGAFRLDAKAEPSLRATVSCIRAIGYFGGSVRIADRWRAYLMKCVDEETGGFADQPGGKADGIVTAVGLMGLQLLKSDDAKLRARAVTWMVAQANDFESIRMAAAGLEAAAAKSERNAAWIAALRKEQNADGTFGSGANLAADTGSKVACLLRLGATLRKDQRDAIIKALDAAQRRDGGYGVEASDLALTYRIVRTYHMLGGKPARADDLRAFLAKCRNADGGYGVAPGQPSSASGTYFAGIILHWLDA
jgi:prenyltransferase beta subunit